MRPLSSSVRNASRTVERLTCASLASALSEGMRSPSPNSPETMRWRIIEASSSYARATRTGLTMNGGCFCMTAMIALTV